MRPVAQKRIGQSTGGFAGRQPSIPGTRTDSHESVRKMVRDLLIPQFLQIIGSQICQ